ncbi:hypothetical protein [Bacillus sp. J37]|uniref:UPF0738 family protein n=1 Tax=Bacillus sp. J37 TaxID=935837 RepID=UPI000479A525|nr:hypothetical protein [Bacillus sp. J37]
MNTRIELVEAKVEDHVLILEPAEISSGLEQSDVKAQGQMLVDSDQLAFIYILESEDEFVYASLPHQIWPHLKEAMDKEFKVAMKWNNKQIELENLTEELRYLLENIKDNANYGDEMESKVVELFSLS